jgi:hypothetical protein
LNYKNDADETQADTFVISKVLWFLTVIPLFILFFIGGPSYYSSPVFKELWDIGHILFFALTTYKLIQLIKYKSISMIILLSFLYCFFLGVTIEILQSKIGRNLDLHDIYRNALGTFLALSIYSYQKGLSQRVNYQVYSYFIIAVLLIIIDQNKLFQTILIDIKARYNFPSLARFEHKNELKQWSGNKLSLSTDNVLTGIYSLKVEFDTKTKYSDVTLRHMPSDWNGFSYLLINIYNPNQEAVKITTKITDYKHDLGDQLYNDRYNKSFTLLKAQWSIIKISLEDIKNSPDGRKLKLDDISRLSLFTTSITRNRVIYIDSVTLI